MLLIYENLSQTVYYYLYSRVIPLCPYNNWISFVPQAPPSFPSVLQAMESLGGGEGMKMITSSKEVTWIHETG